MLCSTPCSGQLGEGGGAQACLGVDVFGVVGPTHGVQGVSCTGGVMYRGGWGEV